MVALALVLAGGTVRAQTRPARVALKSTVDGLRLTSLDVSGTYVAQVTPGSKQRHNKPGFRMRATYVETPKGFYMVKLMGPSTTIDNASGAFEEFLGSLAFR